MMQNSKMDNLRITSKEKLTFMIMMGIGLLSMILSYFMDADEHHVRFWSNFLHEALFFTGIGVMALFFLSVSITALAGWVTVFKRVWEAFALFLSVGFVLMLILSVALYFDWHHLYHWADASEVAKDKVLTGKSSFLNKGWYIIGGLVIVGIWYLASYKIRQYSLQEDADAPDEDFSHHRKMRVWAAFSLPFIGFSSAAAIWLWLMSVDAHWYSTLFAWYTASSWFIAMLCLTVLIILYLKGKGYFANFNNDHLHDLGKYIFGISIFWTYLWFSQFMLIWYANIGEETVYFRERIDSYPVLFYGNLIINFILPFFVLMRNDTKRKQGSMVLVAVLLFIGHWIDVFLMVKPGVLHTAHALASHGEAVNEMAHGMHESNFVSGFTLPGFLEFGTLIGFLGLFLYVVFRTMTKASLTPKNDPYLQESIHHHV